MLIERFDNDYADMPPAAADEPVAGVPDNRAELMLALQLPEYETDCTWWAIRLFLTRN